MTGNKSGLIFQFNAEIFFQNAHNRHRIGHQSRLGIGRKRQLVFRSFDHQFEQILREGVVDFLKYLLGSFKILCQFFSHADKL